MPSEPIVLTIDMGTQSARALLCDSNGAILAKAQKTYDPPYYSLRPGWAEQKPEFYWSSICECTRKLKAEYAELWGGVIAVSVSTIRDTFVCLDEHMEPLRDIIVWLDTRESTQVGVPGWMMTVLKAAGLAEMVKRQRAISHCNWLAEFEPENWRKTAKYALLSGWLNYKFCGTLADAVASCVGHLPFSNKRGTWLPKGDMTRMVFDVSEDKQYDVVPSGTVLGSVTAKAAEETGVPVGIPVVATGSDKSCEILGLGCMNPDQAALSFSTTATIEITTPVYFEPLPHMPSYNSILPKMYTPEFEIYRGYWLISWFKKEFAALERASALELGVSPESLLNQHLAEVPPGCDGLMLHPYFTPGLTMPQARGSFIGFADYHTRMHMYRAIVEGINFSLMEGLRLIEKKSKTSVQRLYVAGGGSQSVEICQITANQFGLPLFRTHTHEVTGLGSSLVAFVSQGVYRTMEDAVKGMVHYQTEFRPDPAQAALYQKLYNEVFSRIYDKLQPFYSTINRILQER
ncbi:MAG: FGGY-family carbohydrate kinase [Oscillospiraceae bacterium]|jgi:sugar (pentulose or hexulose) kinase|nr:FGGY-family carbohydrate kinase [Oscillospiraceae bacterium]